MACTTQGSAFDHRIMTEDEMGELSDDDRKKLRADRLTGTKIQADKSRLFVSGALEKQGDIA